MQKFMLYAKVYAKVYVLCKSLCKSLYVMQKFMQKFMRYAKVYAIVDAKLMHWFGACRRAIFAIPHRFRVGVPFASSDRAPRAFKTRDCSRLGMTRIKQNA